RVRFWIERLWQIAAQLIGSDFRLRIFTRTFCIRPREFGVHAVDESELPITANVIVVGVGVEDHHRTRRQLGGEFANVADAHAGVEETRLLAAENGMGDDFFRLMRFVNRENLWPDFVGLEPRFVGQYAFERFVFRPGKRAAPFGFFRLWRRPCQIWPKGG